MPHNYLYPMDFDSASGRISWLSKAAANDISAAAGSVEVLEAVISRVVWEGTPSDGPG